MIDWNKIRKSFPFLKQGIIYFDSAANSLKPENVIDSVINYYRNFGLSNKNYGITPALKVEEEKQKTREILTNFLGIKMNEIFFTSGTPDSLDRISKMLLDVLEDGDEILLSELNHPSNVLPWIELKKYRKIEVKFSSNLYNDINEKTKVISYSQESNNFDFNEDLAKIYKKAKEYKSWVINDAAQAIAHQKVSFDFCDAFAFSSNKFYGPTGMGVLAVKNELLNFIKPVFVDKKSSIKINLDGYFVLQDSGEKFGSRSSNIAGLIQLKESFIFIQKVGIENIFNRIKELSNYLYTKLNEVENIEIFNKRGSSLYMFNIKGKKAEDIIDYLATKKIILRSAVFCCNLSPKCKGTKALARISLGMYNTFEEIDKFIEELKNIDL
ncbi:aminotransferase class V-fold PLP-dependent enzyme [Mycoplasmopsis pulmonis]|nr:aminotransferase class V-fold PLP-dependent enzyme [Mycoplasmopsis pulmonis]MDZ7293139.1 aminotransferase class V-fold PLP-dependent enzyme [Mycoplasmopsis pulmonis]VEU67936.1 Probable cysteine desulfurase [Mycoplasmopsis pulmonis]